jgi:two-component system sensor histidine kinase MprB
LTSLRTNIDLLLRSERSGRAIPPAQREALFTDVRRQLEELSELAGELTVLAHEDAPDGGRPLLPVRLDEVVQAAVQRVRPRAGERRIELTIEPWLLPEADRIGLERAVVNLLDNAIKFSPAASTIRVALADGTLTVDDEGPGVPAEQRREAFARFWRGEQARALPGSGLGLAIVADAVSRQHGTVALEPVPDRAAGTRAVVNLPGHAVDQDEPAPHSDAGAGVPLP